MCPFFPIVGFIGRCSTMSAFLVEVSMDVIKKLKELRIKKGSRKLTDYEQFKRNIYYSKMDEVEYEQALKDAANYIGI